MERRKMTAGLSSAAATVAALVIFDPHVVLPVLSAVCVVVAVSIAGVAWRRGWWWYEGQRLDIVALLSTAVVAVFLTVVW